MTPSEKQPIPENKKAGHDWIELDLPPTIQEAEALAEKRTKKGRGRPHTNPTIEEYTIKALQSRLESSIDRIFDNLAYNGLWLRDDTELDTKHVITKDDRYVCRIGVPGNGPNYRVGFSDGLKVAVEIFQRQLAPEMFFEMIENNGLTLNATKEAIRREALKERNKKNESLAKIDQLMQEFMKKHHPIPGDIVRKVRRPAVPRKKILRFTQAIKEMEGPAYIEEVAEELKLTIEAVKELYQEALRQRFVVKIGKNKEREFFYT